VATYFASAAGGLACGLVGTAFGAKPFIDSWRDFDHKHSQWALGLFPSDGKEFRRLEGELVLNSLMMLTAYAGLGQTVIKIAGMPLKEALADIAKPASQAIAKLLKNQMLGTRYDGYHWVVRRMSDHDDVPSFMNKIYERVRVRLEQSDGDILTYADLSNMAKGSDVTIPNNMDLTNLYAALADDRL
jgi:hypothetical protein